MKQRSERIRFPPESETVEWKQSLSEWKEIVETCAAFATAQGGTVYVGISPNGEAVGIDVGKGTMEDIINKIASNTSPRLVPSVSTTIKNGITVINVLVKEATSKPVWAFDRPLRRSGRTNQRLSQEEAMQLFMDSRNLTWDTTILDGPTVKDVDSNAVRRFLELANAERRWSVSPKTPAEKVLSQLGLCQGKRLKVAGLLLFGRNPQQYMTQAMVRCARFKGITEIHFIDMKVIQGNIVDQLEQAMTFIERNIRMGAEIKGLHREDQWEYPLDALREALVNAICHRDYTSTANVQVRIFDDRLEIWNPGELPAGMTVDDLRKEHESKPRNRLIANAFFLIKYVEQFGTGIRRIIDDCQSRGLPEPEFRVRPGTFIAIFRPAVIASRSEPVSPPSLTGEVGSRPGAESRADSGAESILSALLQQSLSAEDLSKQIGRKTVSGAFKRSVRTLLKRGFIERTIPDKPNSRLQKYRLTAKGKVLLQRGKG
ncbi:MAG: helix-turn-helix domain-containing protein [Verrucomicrobiota bacterium]